MNIKNFLIVSLLSIGFDCYCADLEEELKARKDAMNRIFSIHDPKNPISPSMKIYIGRKFFGDGWRQYSYNTVSSKTLSAEQAIRRNVLRVQVEDDALKDGENSVYNLLRNNYDRTRFCSKAEDKASKMDTQ